jgi:hypothetical protein
MRAGSRWRSHVRTLPLWTVSLAFLACSGDGGTDIVLPSLSITTSTTGLELDPDGYSVAVDGGPAQSIGLDATLMVDRLAEGVHSVALSGLAPNCLTGDNPRDVMISAGGTATASFAISCTATSGDLAVTTSTNGSGSDPDGFVLTLDGADAGAIGLNATRGLTGAVPGTHLLGLTGVAANCQVTGDNPRSVTVSPGQTTPVQFTVNCDLPAPDAGTLEITTATSGISPDPDGYSVSVDGGAGQPIGVNASLALPNISAGQHAVQLLGVAANCSIAGNNPVPVTLAGGGRSEVIFSISCVAPPPGAGRALISAATSGTSPDDSYTVSIDGGSPQALGANGSVAVESLLPGTHSILLQGIAANCAVSGTNPRAAVIAAGQTTTVEFVVTCVAPPPETGSVRFTAGTAGTSPDVDGYTVSIDGGAGQPIGSNASLRVESLSPGNHSAQLAGIAPNCSLSGDNPRTFVVTAGQTATVSLSITCTAAGPSLNLRISNLYITQSTQDLAGRVPLVAGRPAYLRVFVVANQTTEEKPSVLVTFRNGSTITRQTITAPSGATPTTLQEGTLGSSWNLPLQGGFIQPGLSITAEVDPDQRIAETNETDNAFPATGSPLPLVVRQVPTALIRFVPIKQGEEPSGNVSSGNKDQLVETTRRLYPLNSINTDVHTVYQIEAGALSPAFADWDRVLTEIYALQVTEGSDRTYFGVARLDYQFGVIGIGLLAAPAALGTDAASDVNRVVAHELGHTWNQLHTPCANPPAIDPNYPYGLGIGVYGFDVTDRRLKPPSTSDIMGYCPDPWISDYIYKRVMDYRAAHPAGVQTAQSTREPAILIWGRIVNGQPILEPAFHIVTRPQLPERAGPYSVEAVATDGGSLFRLSFEAKEVPDDPSGTRYFAFAVPLDQAGAERLGSLRIDGPAGGASAASRSVGPVSPASVPDSIAVERRGGRVELRWNPSAERMIMVRDPDTGEVLSFARGGRARVTTSKGTLDLVASDGVRSRTLRVVPR